MITVNELSDSFDTLVNSYSTFSNTLSPLDFNEYEKSIFLTLALDTIIDGLYSGSILGDSFEESERLRRYLDDLIVTCNPTLSSGSSLDKSLFFLLPSDILFIIYELVQLSDDNPQCLKNSILEVVPVTHDTYHRIKNNPFRGANSRRVLRLDAGDNMVELVTSYNIDKYTIRYLSRPYPIILVDLPDGLTINGESDKTKECKLNPDFYRLVVQTGVKLAIQSRTTSGK